MGGKIIGFREEGSSYRAVAVSVVQQQLRDASLEARLEQLENLKVGPEWLNQRAMRDT